jgi:hypothetical protein
MTVRSSAGFPGLRPVPEPRSHSSLACLSLKAAAHLARRDSGVPDPRSSIAGSPDPKPDGPSTPPCPIPGHQSDLPAASDLCTAASDHRMTICTRHRGRARDKLRPLIEPLLDPTDTRFEKIFQSSSDSAAGQAEFPASCLSTVYPPPGSAISTSGRSHTLEHYIWCLRHCGSGRTSHRPRCCHCATRVRCADLGTWLQSIPRLAARPASARRSGHGSFASPAKRAVCDILKLQQRTE